MNTQNTHLIRIFALTVIGLFLLTLTQGAELTNGPFDGVGLAFEVRGESRGDDDNYRMLVEENDPQSGEGYWSVYVIFEEKQGDFWNKTTKNLTVEVIRYVDAQEQVIYQEYNTSGFGFVDVHFAFDLEDGNYTIRGTVEGVQMDQKKDTIAIPITSRPPIAVASIIEGDQHLKEITLILDRDGYAYAYLDSSGSWDPDEGQTSFINYTWIIPGVHGDTEVRQTDTTLRWPFNESGEYNITLKAEDPILKEMFSEDWVLVHVVEIPYKPDLTVSILADRYDIQIGERIEITVEIENIGNLDASGFDVNYYNGKGIFDFDPALNIPYGTSRTIQFDYTPLAEGVDRIQVLVDPMGDADEFDEDNNLAFFDLTIHPRPLPEMDVEILFANGSFRVEELTFIHIVLNNTGLVPAENVKTHLYIGNELMVEEIYDIVNSGERISIVYSWIPKTSGNYEPHVIVYVDGAIHDNQYLKGIEITPKDKPDPEETDPIPMVLVAGGGLLLILLGAISLSGIENAKYKLLGSLVMTPLYTRLKKEDTLNHEVRARVYEHILSHPGVSYATILKSLDLKNGTLVHHLRTLEREHYVKSKKDGKFKRFYQWGTKVGDRDPRFLTDIQMEIVDIIKGNPGVSQANIANSLHRSRQSINYQIKILADAGLINVIKHGISTRCYELET